MVNAEGPNALQHPRRTYGDANIMEVALKGDADLRAISRYIDAHEDDIGTVVLDSIGEVHKALLNEMVDAGSYQNATLQQFGLVNNRIERFARWMLGKKPVFVMVCHEQIQANEMTGNMMKMPMTGGKALPPILCAMVDVVGYTGISVKEGETTYYTNFVSDGQKYGKDRTNRLGTNRVSNISRWIALANAPESEDDE